MAGKKRSSSAHSSSSLEGFRKSGSFQFEHHSIQVLIHPKTGQLIFEEEGQPVRDLHRQNLLMAHFQTVNRMF